jgi:hypothetical protein
VHFSADIPPNSTTLVLYWNFPFNDQMNPSCSPAPPKLQVESLGAVESVHTVIYSHILILEFPALCLLFYIHEWLIVASLMITH